MKVFLLIIVIWLIVFTLKHFGKHLTKSPLVRWKKYEYYENGDIKSITHPKFFNTGYKYTFAPDGTLCKKEYMQFRKVLEDGYEIYYPSGRLKYKHVVRY